MCLVPTISMLATMSCPSTGTPRMPLSSPVCWRPNIIEPANSTQAATPNAERLSRRLCVQKADDFCNCPNVNRNASLHRRGYAHRLVDPPEVVIHKVECHGCRVVFDFF